jgi:hypothetical protein
MGNLLLEDEESIALLLEEDEDGEMPNFTHSRLQYILLQLCNNALAQGFSAYPPITFRNYIWSGIKKLSMNHANRDNKVVDTILLKMFRQVQHKV